MLNNRKKTLGVFVCKLPEYFQRTLCGALADEAVANGYNLVVFSTFGEYDNNHDYVREKAIVFIFQIMTNWMGLFYALMCLIFLAWQEN